jgi:hypothetical protein
METVLCFLCEFLNHVRTFYLSYASVAIIDAFGGIY